MSRYNQAQGRGMRIIDAHAHVTSEGEELGIVRDLDETIRHMDRCDIEIAFSSDSRRLLHI